jgi:hypothetical protein
MAITNYQFTATHAHMIEGVPISNNSITLIQNLGPSTIYLGDTGNAGNIPANLISNAFGYALRAGESLQLEGGTNASWLAFNTAPDPDDNNNDHTAVVRVMIID